MRTGEPQPAERGVLPEPGQQAALPGLGVGSPSPGPCAWQIAPEARFSRGLSCFLTPEVLQSFQRSATLSSEIPEAGRIPTGNACLPHPLPFHEYLPQKQEIATVRTHVEKQSSVFNHKKLLPWKD